MDRDATGKKYDTSRKNPHMVSTWDEAAASSLAGISAAPFVSTVTGRAVPARSELR
jgi:hypothetical protein